MFAIVLFYSHLFASKSKSPATRLVFPLICTYAQFVASFNAAWLTCSMGKLAMQGTADDTRRKSCPSRLSGLRQAYLLSELRGSSLEKRIPFARKPGRLGLLKLAIGSMLRMAWRWL